MDKILKIIPIGNATQIRSGTVAYVIGPRPYSQEWHGLRKYNPLNEVVVRFGASEAAQACGMSRYESRLSLYISRVRGFESESSDDNDDLWLGHELEATTLRYYVRKTSANIESCVNCYISEEYPWLIATPDAMQIGDDGKRFACIDAKHTSWFAFKSNYGEEYTDEVPTEILLQAQQQMLVMGVDLQYTVVFVDKKLKIFEVKRSDALCEMLIRETRTMYSCIKEGIPPEPNFDIANDVEIVKKLAVESGGSGAVTKFDDRILACYLRMKKAAEVRKKIEKIENRLKAEVLNGFGEADVGVCGGGITLRKSIVHNSGYTKVVEPYSYPVIKEIK
ncbi:YqaJ viral recombinase family protein [Candidatus Kaiserbacteria bacterium]|nr:YqaJ viral recombinase family protein [Candidatus Kaiserbacteria bacterium]